MNPEALKKQREEAKEGRARQINAHERYIELIKKEQLCRQLEMELFSRYIDEGEFSKTFKETAIANPKVYPEYDQYKELVNHIGTYNGIESARIAQINSEAKLVEAKENLEKMKEKNDAL